MISSPGWVCLGASTPGAMSTRTWISSRPGMLRSCCCRSVRSLLSARRLQHQHACGRRRCHDPKGFHVSFPLAPRLADRPETDADPALEYLRLFPAAEVAACPD